MGDVRTPTSLEDQASLSSPVGADTLPSEPVFDALKMILLGAPLNEILTSVTRLIEAHSEGMLCSIFLVEEDGLHLRYAGTPNLPEAYRVATDGVCIGPNVGSCGTAAYLRQPVFVSDIASDPRWAKFRGIALPNGLRAAWSNPIISHDDKVLGTFCSYYREVRHPGPSDIQLIDSASRIAAVAIERDRSQTALTTAFEKIKKAEAEYRQIVDAIPQAIHVLDSKGRVLYSNKWHLEYTGLEVNDVRSADYRARILHPADFPSIEENRERRLAAGVPFEIEQRARRADGQYRWFLFRYNPLRDEHGRVTRWYATGTDIERRKQAEEKLRQDERELRQLINFLPQHVLVLDAEGSLLQANQMMLDYNGHTLEEMQGLGTDERVKRDLHPDDFERVRDERRSGFSSGVPFEIEKRMLGKDGRYHWFLFRYNPLLNEEGRIARWFATATDIEDRKQAEQRIRNENLALREEIDRDSIFEDIIGSSEPLAKVLRQVAKVALSDSTVLILGETGTGKELIARAIHKRSKRAERAFIGVNCAAIPPSLIASELFGYEKGAFTGATQRRLGRFESANGGTIFLDEIGDLPPEIQIALLRVLQERQIERVGSNKPISIDVRVLAATHRDLNALVAEGKFRRDLLYRLNVVPIELPSLCERAADIPLLVEYLIDRFGKKAGKKFTAIDKRTLKLFQAYGWPGNIRELQNVVERAVILSDGDTFSVEESWLKPEPHQVAASRTVALEGVLQRQEKEMIEAALAESHGRISGPAGAAAKLGLPTRSLDSKIKRLGINKYQFKVT
jgi:formate hydrogenlyase transcriptional activator